MTDYPTDTDIIAAHQLHVFLLAVRTGPDDDGPFWSAQCTAHHGTCSWLGVDTLTRDEAVRAHAAHVAEALTAARRVETVADRLRAGADAADRADEALDLLNDTLPTGRILALKLTLDDIADRLRQRADELDPPDSKDQP